VSANIGTLALVTAEVLMQMALDSINSELSLFTDVEG